MFGLELVDSWRDALRVSAQVSIFTFSVWPTSGVRAALVALSAKRSMALHLLFVALEVGLDFFEALEGVFRMKAGEAGACF